MKTRLCTINLSVKDYVTKEKGSFSYHGEVVVIDKELKQYDFRFYNTDAGTLAVSIDCSKKTIKVVEHSDAINLSLELELNEYRDCVYRFDANNTLNLLTKAWEVEISDDHILFDYDLYPINDSSSDGALTRNIVRIDFEGENKIC